MVAELVDLEKQTAAAAKRTEHLASPSDIDTSDDSDGAEEEYQKWMRREAARVKREEAMRDPAAARRAEEQRAAAAEAAAGPSGQVRHARGVRPVLAFGGGGAEPRKARAGAEQAQVSAKVLPRRRLLPERRGRRPRHHGHGRHLQA